jgi:hypothetical protein
MISKTNKLLYAALSISLTIGLYYGEDSSGSGGSINDFFSTWPLIENPFNFDCGCEMKFPLHYFIASTIYHITGSELFLRIIFCLVAIFVPYLFYKCLRIKYPALDKNNLFLFSLILLILPTFRSAAIWPNTHLTGTVFFLASIFFFLKWEAEQKFKNINTNLLLTIIFMSLTVYTRQMYAIIFLYFVLIYFQKLNLSTFIKTCFIIFLIAIPGFLFVLQYPIVLTGTFDPSLNNSLLVNSSIMAFYLIPFYFIIFINDKEKLNLINVKNLVFFVTSIVLVFALSQSFDYNFKMGGGYFLKLSILLFNNFNLFYITSITGFFLLYLLAKEKPNNAILILMLLLGFSARILFPKYFEPMLIFLLFFIFKNKFSELFLEKRRNVLIYSAYLLLYLLTGIANQALNLTKSL